MSKASSVAVPMDHDRDTSGRDQASSAPAAREATPPTDRASFALLLAALLLVPILPRITPLLIAGRVMISDVLVVFAGALALPLIVRERQSIPKVPVAFIVTYLIAGAMSSITAPHPTRTLVKVLGVGTLAALAILVWLHGRRRARLDLMADVWLGGAAIVTGLTCIGVVAFFVLGPHSAPVAWTSFNSGSLPPGHYPRVSGLMLNGNMYCNYLLVTTGVLLYRWAAISRRYGAVAAWALASLIGLSVIFSLSTGWGGFAIGFVVIAMCLSPGAFDLEALRAPARLLKLRVPVVALSFLFAAFMAFITVFAIVPHGKGDVAVFGPLGDIKFTSSGRLSGWVSVLQTIKNHPLLGQGLDEPVAHIRNEWATQGVSSQNGAKVLDLEAHNIWLGLWGQAGPLAVIGFGGLCIALVRRLRAAAVAPANRFAAVAFLATFAGAIGYHGLFCSAEDSRHVWVLFGFVMAVASLPAAATRASASSPTPQEGNAERVGPASGA